MENNRSLSQQDSMQHPASGTGAQKEHGGTMDTQHNAGGEQQNSNPMHSDDMDTLNELEKKHGRGNSTRKGNSSIPED